MRKLYVLIPLLFFFLINNAQTVLINPATDGGFETGTDFISNGWTVVNASTNKWFCGSVATGSPNTTWFTGNRGAYISNNSSGTTWNYSTSVINASHFYRDIAFPAGETTITLKFDWRGDGNDGNYDNLQVYLIPTTSTPTTASPTGTSTAPSWLSGGYFLLQRNGSTVPSTTTNVTYVFSAAQAAFAAGNTCRLVFTWKNDDLFGDQPPAAIDNISLTSSCTPPITGLAASSITPSAATLNWDPAAGATGYQVRYKKVSDAATVSTWATPTNTVNPTLNLSGLTSATDYEFQVAGVGVSCTTFTTSTTFTTLCNSASIPTVTESFETVALPVCWNSALVTGTTAWGTTTSNDGVPSAHTGSKFMGKVYTNSDALLFSQPIDMTTAGANGARVNVWIYRNTVNDPSDRIRFHINTTASLSGASQLLEIYPQITVSPSVASIGWYNYTADIPASYNTEPVVYIIAEGTTTAGFSAYGIGFDDFKVEAIPTCDAPTAITVSNITSTGADLDWTPPTIGSPANYQVYYNTTGTAPTGATTPTYTNVTNPYSLTTLSANTTYYVWIRSNCGVAGGIGPWSNQVTFKTACSASTSFNENFDAVTTPALPDCWSKLLRNVAGIADVTTVTGTAQSTPNSVSLYNSSSSASADIMLVSPPVSNLNAGTYRLKFWARASDPSQDLVIGTLDNLSASANFSVVQTVDINGTYAEYTVDFSGYTSTDQYIAIKRLSTVTYTTVYIDNVRWEVIPTCDIPSAILVSNITTTGAGLDWTAPAIGSPSNYQVYVSTTSTAPTGSTTPTLTNVNNPVTLSGLTANTTYYVWVRTNCGGSNVSAWTNAPVFSTLCNATNVPYTQDFESSVVPAIPSCTAIENAGSGNNWTTMSSPGSGFNTIALSYVYNTSNAANAWFYTQGLNLVAGTSYRLSFKYGNNSTFYTEKLEVKYGNAPANGSMTDLIVNYPTINTNSLSISTTDFTPSASGVYYIGFHAYSAANQYNLYVDDISVIVTPTCNEPTGLSVSNLTTTGAQANWTAPSTGTPVSYQVYYNTTGTAPTGSTTPTLTGISATTATFSGLSANTTYYVWIRTFCGGTDVSSWIATPVTFTTPCNATSVPYTQDFESAPVPGLPSCTTIENAGAGNNWVTASAPGSGFTTIALKYGYNSSNAANAWFYTQGLNLTAGTSYRLKFKYGNNSTTYVEKLEVYYGTAPSSASMTNAIVNYPSINTNTLTISTTDFTPSASGVYYIGFHAYSVADQYNLYVDDISVIATPTCNEPTAVNVSNIATTGAQLNWTAPSTGTPVSYQVYYNTTGTAPTGSTTPTASNLSGLTTNLSGLTANTTYYLWMRTFCGGTDVSIWTASPVTFTTLCNAVNGFSENFDALTTPALPNCWSRVGTGGTSQTQSTSANSSPNALYIYSSSTSSIAVLAMPRIGNLSAGTFRLRFKARANFTAGGIIQVGYLTDPTNAATFTLIQAITASTLTYQDFIVNIPALPAGVEFLAFRHTGSPANSVLIDDIFYEVQPAFPVSLISFTGTKDGSVNRLNWSTSTEINNKGFELERSADGKNYTAISYLPSKADNGNSTSVITYNYNDAKPLSGNNYYRLKQIDKDGRITYSGVIILKNKISEIMISSVYPNPAKEELNLVITSPSAERLTVVITDLSGKIVMQQSTNVLLGDNEQQLNIQKLAAGTYVIKAICANGCETAVHRFVKQ